jgi:hypothetical protein
LVLRQENEKAGYDMADQKRDETAGNSKNGTFSSGKLRNPKTRTITIPTGGERQYGCFVQFAKFKQKTSWKIQGREGNSSRMQRIPEIKQISKENYDHAGR